MRKLIREERAGHVFFHCCGSEGELLTPVDGIVKRHAEKSAAFWKRTAPGSSNGGPLFALPKEVLSALLSRRPRLVVKCKECGAEHEIRR